MNLTYYKTEYLDELETQKLIQFNDDEIMKEAVRKVLLAEVYERGVLKKGKKADPLQNFLIVLASKNRLESNEALGAQLKALYEGINFVEMGFNEIGRFKPEPEAPKKGLNQAR